MIQPPHQAEVEFAAVHVHAGDLDLHQIAQAIAVAVPVAGQRVRLPVVAIVVVAQGVDADQPSAGSSMPWANSPNSSTPVTTASISSPMRWLR